MSACLIFMITNFLSVRLFVSWLLTSLKLGKHCDEASSELCNSIKLLGRHFCYVCTLVANLYQSFLFSWSVCCLTFLLQLGQQYDTSNSWWNIILIFLAVTPDLLFAIVSAKYHCLLHICHSVCWCTSILIIL